MVANLDIMPTVLDAAGVSAPAGLDGSSFLPLLQGRPAALARHPALRVLLGAQLPADTHYLHALRTARYKYIRYHGIWDIDELYDLQADPARRQQPDLQPRAQTARR